MDLDFSDDQRLLRDMVDRFAADAGGLERHRTAIRSDIGWSRETWRQMAELGLLGIPVSEEDDGLGGGGSELMIVGEAFGRHLLTEPFLDSAVIAGSLLSGGEGQGDLLAGLMGGSRIFALVEHGVGSVDGRLNGRARGVPHGGVADWLIVAAGEGLYIVSADAHGLTRNDYPCHGGGRLADIAFDGVEAKPLAHGQAAADLLTRARERRVAFLAAEALGAAEGAFAATVEYLKTRVQFGQPIGANQSLQHRAAEMFVEIEQLRSAAIFAACMLDEPDAAERAKALAAVAMVAVKTARFVAQQAVQLHGGIGVTEEHVVGHWFLRLTAIGLFLGGTDANARALADLGGIVAAAPYWATAT